MIPLPANVRVWLATGHTDMRKGFSSLGMIVQETLRRDPHSGHLFVFRGRRGDLIKVIWHDGQGGSCPSMRWKFGVELEAAIGQAACGGIAMRVSSSRLGVKPAMPSICM